MQVKLVTLVTGITPSVGREALARRSPNQATQLPTGQAEGLTDLACIRGNPTPMPIWDPNPRMVLPVVLWRETQTCVLGGNGNGVVTGRFFRTPSPP